MTRATQAILSKQNLQHNLQIIKKQAHSSQIIAMIKANAYGHNIVSTAQQLTNNVEAFGVASCDEALELRSAGINNEIILIEGVFNAGSLELAATNNFSVVIHNKLQLEWLSTQQLQNKIKIWIKINTGMSRLGFDMNDVLPVYDSLHNNKNIKGTIGLMSHFACADEKEHLKNQEQIKKFNAITSNINTLKSMCNSAAIFNFPEQHFDYVRPGLALYGASPLANVAAEQLDLKPVMTFQTELIAIHQLKQGDAVGYGARYECPKDMLVGVAAVGYGDGYPRNAQDGTPTLINGNICPIVGKVSMDMITIDLSNASNSQIKDKVILWGEGLPIEQVVPYTNHSSYDLLTGLQQRVNRIWQ